MIQLYLAGALAAAVAVSGSYMLGRSHGADSAQADQAERERLIQESRQAMQEVAAEAIAAIEVRHVTIKQEAVKTIVERPVYRECRHDDDMWVLLNRARGFDDWKPPVPSELPRAAADQ